jgi:tuberculosinol/isotuberculosinol synthase
MDPDQFLALSRAEIASLMRRDGDKICVFPINGTRRWFLLEHPPQQEKDWLSSYLVTAAQRHIELYGLCFDHGIGTLVTPIFGPDLVERGPQYMQLFAEGLARMASHEQFLSFYDRYRVRVRFYGDHRRFFAGTPYEYLSELFDKATERTRGYEAHRLFIGVCAHDAAPSIAELSIRHHNQTGAVPDRQMLISLYYGEPVRPASLFIGFDKLVVFDMPLLATGDTDLYFTVCPSPYLDGTQLRAILYDHLFGRKKAEPSYGAMEEDHWRYMRLFYQANRGVTLGVGRRRGQIWYPHGGVVEPNAAPATTNPDVRQQPRVERQA